MLAVIGGGLGFRGCHLSSPGDDGVVLWAERIRIDGDAFLVYAGQRPFVADGGLRLSGATIAGGLSCVGAQLRSADRDGASLMAQRIKVGGDVGLTSNPGETGFSAKGTINLTGAEIAGALICSSARWRRREPGRVDGCRYEGRQRSAVGQRVQRCRGYRTAGRETAANLVCRGGTQLNGVNAYGCALNVGGIRVGGHLQISEGFRAAGVIFLVDADISGDVMVLGAQLDCGEAARRSVAASGMKVGGAVVFGDGLAAAGAIELRGAEIAANLFFRGDTRLDGANTEGNSLQADGVKIGGHLLISGNFTSNGAVDLVDAEIGGNLECRGVHLRGRDQKGSALHAERITVGGQVYLDQGFRADGTIYLLGAHINGNLECRGAQVGSRSSGRSIYAERITVGGDVYLDSYPGLQNFTADGTVYLLNAEIGGMLSCRGAKLRGSGASEGSLFAQRMSVGRDVYLTDGFSASGIVQLRAATIAGSLELAPDRLQEDKRWLAIDATVMKVSGRLRWTPERQIQGRVSP